MSPSVNFVTSLFDQMVSLDNIRPMVDMEQGFRYPGEPKVYDEYVMVYSNGWIYLEFEDHEVGHIWRFDYDGIIRAINHAYYQGDIEHGNAVKYLTIFQGIKGQVRFKKHWYLYNLEYTTLMTLDGFIMFYATVKERVFELPNLVLPEEDTWDASTWSTHESDVDSVFVELWGGEKIEPTIFETHFDTLFFDLDTDDEHEVDILWETTDELERL